MSKILDVEWQCWHVASVDIDALIDSCKYRMKKYHSSLEEVIDDAIEGYVSGLDDATYYGWTDDAQEQVKQAIFEGFGGEQLSMFD